MKSIPHQRSREVEAWLKRELREQKLRYRKIVEDQDALEPKRTRWVEQFLQRIQTRGFHFHSNLMRKIRPEEIPVKPKRKFKVVF